MEIDILTIFPGMFDSPLKWGVLSRAVLENIIRIRIHDIRDHAVGPYKMTDDYPYGGGQGMVMKPEPIFSAIDRAKNLGAEGPVILMSPQGEVFTQETAKELAALEGMTLLCGRYEGVDERVRIGCVDREISIGDYILTGGEPAAIVVIDAVARLLEGVLGNAESTGDESFETGLLEYPQYTRPRVFNGMEVPPVLLSGHHQNILDWRRKESLKRTLKRRPELIGKAELDARDHRLLEEIRAE